MISKQCSIVHGSYVATAALAAVVFAGSTALTRGDTVNIQFEGVNPVNSTDSFSGQQGAYTADGVASPTWNVFGSYQGTGTSLMDSSGNTTSSTVSYISNGNGYYNYQLSTPANNLLSGWLIDISSETVTLNGLTDNGTYQLYLYGEPGAYSTWGDGNSRGTMFSITTGSGAPAVGSNAYTLQKALAGSAAGTFTENTNYVIFNATANAAGTLGITWTVTPGGTVQAVGENGESGSFNGLQLVSTPVPEPLTLGLLSIGGMGLLLLKRRRMI